MERDRLISILAGARRSSQCRDCGRPIEWGISAPHGKYVPLDPNPLVLRYDRNAGGVKFLVISANNLHFLTCKKRRQEARRPRVFGGRGRP